jgi:hypothetical protein
MILPHRTLVGIGTKRHFAATQQSVAFGGKADMKMFRRDRRQRKAAR